MRKGFVQTKVDSIRDFFEYDCGKFCKWIAVIVFIATPFIVVLHHEAYPDMTGGTIVFAVILEFLCYIFYELSKFYGAEATEIPVPSERFTTVDKDGMVSVDKNRIQEMIIYVGEVEDYLSDAGRI